MLYVKYEDHPMLRLTGCRMYATCKATMQAVFSEITCCRFVLILQHFGEKKLTYNLALHRA